MPRQGREEAITQTHDELGHKGAWSTVRQLQLRVWWPGMEDEVAAFVRTCARCQARNPQNVYLPIQVSIPANPFRKLHADVVFFPKAHGYQAAVLVRDNMSGYIEGRRLRRVDAKSVAKFLWEEVLTRWGAVAEIVTDNGKEFKGAAEVLLKRYSVHQIRISAYNKQGNGVIERGHRTFREALLRSSDKPSDWPKMFHAALWAERATIRKATGYSPYFLAHGTHPLLPFDVTEATFLFGEPEPMSTKALVARRARMLAKLDSAIEQAKDRLTKSRYRSKTQFEQAHAAALRREPLAVGTPVLVRNSRFDNEINAKSHDRWLGPYVVVRIGRNGAYRLAELNGAVLAEPVAASRVIQFYPRHELRVKPEDLLDGAGWERVREGDDAESPEESDEGGEYDSERSD
ncbi:Retrovirus-related Pol polyprotein from transposon 412 Includes: RecName: Full=Protease [Rhizoctonia solani AG-1 IB]|uniref:Rhizoctonia solani AG1-IB WGS project CAOJ00000000 data, isolate 7/3/14, contig 21515 n=1 Tax=Thanatephorus cucumeris (strain AG1-IB / isolate 7/3/14) TaxID=1108050 RepID=M5C7B7_THACB|nr:Retrovirus-related Pol polyprotein from transposon 412 Includes: RecName: Full=Protease [Rhizoctonia solani AG-1 IB]